MSEQLMNAETLVKRLGGGVTVTQLRGWAHRRLVPFYRAGRGRFLFKLSEVQEALRQHYKEEAIANVG